jgi:pyruvate,orthophosphate dikinase
MGEKWVYNFNQIKTDGNRHQKDLLGGKGANLAEMSSLNFPVPPGFTITTKACGDYFRLKGLNAQLQDQVISAIHFLQRLSQKTFGGLENPLLFSIRSGAKASMPGMMDTILNLGLNDKTVEGISRQSQNPWFAWDSYRRFIGMYSNVVLGVPTYIFENILEDLKEARQVHLNSELSVDDLKNLVRIYKDTVAEETGVSFPQDPYEQLWHSIGAVFKSWHNPRAKKYRELHGIPDDWGTAVNVQSMVFGNLGETSATGVAFTRDPGNGEKKFFGEFLLNAQGEDVVAGLSTPHPINNSSKNESNKEFQTLEEALPNAYTRLYQLAQKLELHFEDMQDIEFTIEKGELYLLQTRNGKRTVQAGIKIVSDLVKEKIISESEAVLRIKPEDLNQLLHPCLDPKAPKTLLARGLPASPGAASGRVYFTADDVQKAKSEGQKCLLVRPETSPEDIAGMVACEGILTAKGGMTSHAAVVARGMGKPCITGCQSLFIDMTNLSLRINDLVVTQGEYLTINGATGEIFQGIVPTCEAQLNDDFFQLMAWADKFRTLKIRTNADSGADAQVALKFGAEGIGLCRTEHMFFDPERIFAVREMIFATDTKERQLALKKLKPFQVADFKKIFMVMKGKPVNIRLLDPPLHEFLPQTHFEMEELAHYLNLDIKTVEQRIENLKEVNPMLGFRGCRLGIAYPEIYQMQCQAIIEAAINVHKEGVQVLPEIMIPLIIDHTELKILRDLLKTEMDQILNELKVTDLSYKLGTMIEIPRACLDAEKIAQHADFFSFGTNDLTQTTLGVSRDDSGRFLPLYVEKNILPHDPFATLDVEGVGSLISMAVERGRKCHDKLHIGICGEHGGDSASIQFFHNENFDYVSCSPYRVPIARLSAAQCAIKNQSQNDQMELSQMKFEFEKKD